MNTIKDDYYKRFDADFFPTKEQWESYSVAEQESIIKEAKIDLWDEENNENHNSIKDTNLAETYKKISADWQKKYKKRLDYLLGLKG